MSENAATQAARRSMQAVEAGDKQAWLDNFAEDAVVEDPVGASILDPEGNGHRGKEAIAAFWDANIGPNEVSFDIRESYAAGDEVANVGSITTRFADGGVAVVTGVYTYRVGDDGKLVSLRTHWSMDDVRMD